ncbi:cystathionine gamma-synthase family protein [Undibacterium fentianense]|uniref:Cystathionine gamma-synthase family protein n=1 Tax=Undibacterium fentianense TaxID=2828728 RepID=A0A941DYI2_9BURK|nr:cystathionine gamma-synthase family protein [Undibacterium fentianense]MBR7799100.1 cystathionine gamma-synthase family protein [Undibacterium fentianense]
MSTSSNYGFTTTILHSDRQKEIEHGSPHKPIHTSVTYGYHNARELADVFQGKKPGFRYGRQGNPTVAALEEKISKMEDGVASLCFASGMAAIGAVFQGLLRQGDQIISSRFLFGNTNSVWQTCSEQGIQLALVDATNVAEVEAAITPQTRMVFAETIANPRTQVADLLRIGELCRARGILYVVDNTMTSPYLFRAKEVGAGLVINSLTKSIAGHGNVLGGAITDTGVFDWSAYPHIAANFRKLDRFQQGMAQLRAKALRDFGASLSPEAAHQIAVGAETLALRMERESANALALAQMLESDPRVAVVHYPGLHSHPQHELAKRLFRAFGALLSFELKPEIDCFDFLSHLQLAINATHLGDTRTLVIPVAHTIFFEMGPERRAEMGIVDSLIRVSVGIEDTEDLMADFGRALAQF